MASPFATVVAFFVAFAAERVVFGKVYDRCELARELRDVHEIPHRQLATWVCIAKYESLFNTSAVNVESGDHGLFQISQLYWCSPPGNGWACGLSCAALKDDDLEDDVICARRIFREHQRISGNGFNAWVAYQRYCTNTADASAYIADCFKDEDLRLEDEFNTTQLSTRTESSLFSISPKEDLEYSKGSHFSSVNSISSAPQKLGRIIAYDSPYSFLSTTPPFVSFHEPNLIQFLQDVTTSKPFVTFNVPFYSTGSYSPIYEKSSKPHSFPSNPFMNTKIYTQKSLTTTVMPFISLNNKNYISTTYKSTTKSPISRKSELFSTFSTKYGPISSPLLTTSFMKNTHTSIFNYTPFRSAISSTKGTVKTKLQDVLFSKKSSKNNDVLPIATTIPSISSTPKIFQYTPSKRLYKEVKIPNYSYSVSSHGFKFVRTKD